MPYPNLFDAATAEAAVQRILALTPETQPAWGKMSVSQMLAHVNVAYEMAYEGKHPRPNAIMRAVLKLFVKAAVVGPAPYKKNVPTAPAFKITDAREFEVERDRLITFIRRTAELNAAHFGGKESLSFGPLTAGEWNTLFSKHLDHHLTQFSV